MGRRPSLRSKVEGEFSRQREQHLRRYRGVRVAQAVW